MGAGIFKEKVTIQSPPATRNKYGEIDKTLPWVDFLVTRASFEPLYGRELMTAEQLGSHIEFRFRIRYRDGIESKMKIIYRGVDYEILYPIDVGGKHVELLLYCKKVS